MEDLKRLAQERKWLMYTAAGVVGLFVCFWGYRILFVRAESIMSADALAEDLTVTFADSGESIKMTRGDIVRQLLDRPGSAPLPPETRVGHPKTGKQSGMVGSEASWRRFLEDVNTERSFKGKPVGPR